MGVLGRLQRSQPTAPQGNGHVPPCALRRRLRRLGGRHPSSRRGAAGRSRSGSSSDGSAPVGGEDDDRSHRRGLRLLGLPHAAATPERLEQAVRLHLAIEEGARLHQGQGAGDHPRRHEPTARSRTAPTEPVLRDWANYFRHGVSKATFDYLDAFSWRRVICWLRHKHRRASWKWPRRRYLPGWRPTDGEATLFNPRSIAVTRYRYRGAQISTPWTRAEATVA